jgi:hypothetical protein
MLIEHDVLGFNISVADVVAGQPVDRLHDLMDET